VNAKNSRGHVRNIAAVAGGYAGIP